MKNVILTFVCLSFTFFTIAQTIIEDELAQNKGLIMDCTGNLEQIQGKIKEIKKKADRQFVFQQSIIDLQQKDLDGRRELIEARDENNMRLDELVYHISDKESLVREQSRLDLKQLQLTQRIIDFTTRMMQIEQHVATNYVDNVNMRNQSHSAHITAYIEELDRIAFD